MLPVNDSLSNPARKLRQAFGDSLYTAAERVAHGGNVLEIRVLQAGNVVTGIVGADAADPQRAAKFRVYIRNLTAKMEGECSCGERGVCVHVAAVSIVAAQTMAADASDERRRDTPPARARGVDSGMAPRNAALQSAPAQQLCYLLEKVRGNGSSVFSEIQVSVWVAQRGADVGSIIPGSACAFASRLSRGVSSAGTALEFPRYVEAQDREILQVLAPGSDGPWAPGGDVGAGLLLRIAATGRAFWQSLHGRALRGGEPRTVAFAWKMLPGGEQILSWEGIESLDVVSSVEPPVYIDSASNEAGRVDLPWPVGLLREHAQLPPVTPEQVAALNVRIDEVAGSWPFPRLRNVPALAQALVDLKPRLLMSAAEQAVLYFVYNGVPVDSRRLLERQDAVRLMAGDSLYEIPRDVDRERLFESQLAGVLGTVPQDRSAWLAFMMGGVPALKTAGWEVVVDERFPYRVVAADQWYGDLGADLRQAAWFNLRLGVVVDGQPVNLLPALTRYLQSSLGQPSAGQSSPPRDAVPGVEAGTGAGTEVWTGAAADAAGCQIGEFWLVRLDDGRYLPIALERIQRIANTLVELFDRDSLTTGEALSLPRSQGGRLAQLAMELNGPTLSSDDSSLAALIEDLKSFSGIRALPAPANFRGQLRPYQQEGLGWLQFLRRFRLGGILADDMGLGKTVQTIAHIALEIESARLNKPVLIVAPVSALGNWQHEFARFAPGLSVYTWHGAQRRKSMARLNGTQVIITAYPLLLIDSEVLLAREFGLVILDEAQMIKNPGAKVSQMARALRAEVRLCLSGTPVENHLGELWSLFDFLQPGLLGDERHFQRHYRTPIERNGDRGRAEALSARLAPFLLRRTKDAVAKELPPKVEIVESITLDEKQRDFYDGVRLAMHQRIQEVIRQQGLGRSQITILDALLKLRQVCCDPRLVNTDDGESRSQRDDAADSGGRTRDSVPSAKLEWLATVLPELVAEGRRILLFSQFTSMLRLIESMLTGLAIPYCLLTGETTDRTAVVDRFQSGEVPLFLISLKAGGTALNLTAADTVIHYDPWWNPAVEAQATDRAHRIGQTKSVFVYKLIAQDTVEERMLQLQADKRVLAGRLYTDKSASPTALAAEDLEMLFAP
jgi:superfamily II DNA or RNA helicase